LHDMECGFFGRMSRLVADAYELVGGDKSLVDGEIAARKPPFDPWELITLGLRFDERDVLVEIDQYPDWDRLSKYGMVETVADRHYRIAPLGNRFLDLLTKEFFEQLFDLEDMRASIDFDIIEQMVTRRLAEYRP
jgi:hypothetical protein